MDNLAPATRERLPNRRASEVFDFEHGSILYTVGVSRNPDGRLAEVFVDGEKVDSATAIAMRDAAIMLSIALQKGCTVEEILPAGTSSRSCGMPTCTSWLGVRWQSCRRTFGAVGARWWQSPTVLVAASCASAWRKIITRAIR